MTSPLTNISDSASDIYDRLTNAQVHINDALSAQSDMAEYVENLADFNRDLRAHVSDLRSRWDNFKNDLPPTNDVKELDEQLRDLESFLDD